MTRIHRHPFLVAVLVGVLAAIGLIVVHNLFRRPFWLLVAYSLFIATIGLCVRAWHPTTFGSRFAFSLTAFMVAGVVDDGYLLIVENPAALHSAPLHLLWPVLLMLAIGTVISLGVAAIVRTPLHA